MSISSSPDISVVIPTFEEQAYVVATLNNLFQQTVADKMEVVIADYDPKNSGLTRSAIASFNRVAVAPVDKAGIGYARNIGVNKSQGRYIVNFDADSLFSKNDAIEKLVAPLKDKTALVTCCYNVLSDGISRESRESAELWQTGYKFGIPPFADTPGITMPRWVYDAVGGFPAVSMGEHWAIMAKIIAVYGVDKRMWVPDVTVITSSRRYKAKDLVGADEAFKYSNAYR